MYEINHLNLITSSFCDLKCSYCFLHKNQAFRNFDKYIIKMWENGEYLSNIIKFFNIVNSDMKKITEISLWGGEPFLHLKSFKRDLGKLIDLCPQLESIVIPTNFVHTNINDLCDLLQEIDYRLTPRTEENFLHFHIQMSIDGIENDIFTKDGHDPGDWNIYLKNLDILFEKLEQIELKNIEIVLPVSATATQKNILERFNSYDNIKEHILFWKEKINYLVNRTKNMKNPQIIIPSRINIPTVAIPDTASIKESLNLFNLMKQISYCFYEEDYPYERSEHLVINFFNAETDWFLRGPNHECPESNQTAITLLPDGTLGACPSAFIENNEEYLLSLLREKKYKEYKKAKILQPLFFNPLKQTTEKEIKDNKWYNVMGGIHDTCFVYIGLNFPFLQEMAASKQINEYYSKNPMLLFKHLTAASTINECFKNSVDDTSLIYCAGQDLMRRWLNSYVEYAYIFHQTEIENALKEIIMKKGKEINNE